MSIKRVKRNNNSKRGNPEVVEEAQEGVAVVVEAALLEAVDVAAVLNDVVVETSVVVLLLLKRGHKKNSSPRWNCRIMVMMHLLLWSRRQLQRVLGVNEVRRPRLSFNLLLLHFLPLPRNQSLLSGLKFQNQCLTLE
jgi:hypothetical protein